MAIEKIATFCFWLNASPHEEFDVGYRCVHKSWEEMKDQFYRIDEIWAIGLEPPKAERTSKGLTEIALIQRRYSRRS